MRNSSINKKQNEGKQITLNRFFRTVKCKKNCLSHDKQSLLTLK